MKLILERINGTLYAYKEDEKQFKAVEPHRSKECNKIPDQVLTEECNLALVLNDNNYMVIDIL